MTPLTQRDILAHQQQVPWPNLRQVEQDLLLCRAMTALFDDAFLKTQIAMRGGTLLHKVHLAPASRYSEDIDLVVIGDRPDEHIRKAINRVLLGVLGRPTSSAWQAVKLAVRNAVKPSKVLRVIYRVPSVADPRGTPLEMVTTTVNGFEIHEMLGTKMRALFQRRRGRDLFDLYWALTEAGTPVNPAEIIELFLYYLQQEGTVATRDEFIGLLQSHLNDRGFLTDMNALLRTGIHYDPIAAGDYVIGNLLKLLPE